ncbi:MAG TPA: Crp/Fnr family transcriptional regulator [Flavobacteriales bacterium]|nr:Crp/Fnr family transcriptional regulator [Flavobacteriales bacterium]HIN40781.1 Crp/Fnr family transcriptional regulator [Flavobacteriales bacterium]
MNDSNVNPFCENCPDLNFRNRGAGFEGDEFNPSRMFNIYKKGETVFSEGNKPTGVFCLKKGKLKIHRTGIKFREQIIRFVAKGELLGARAMIRNEYYTSSATAIEDSLICYIPKKEFMKVHKSSRKLSEHILKNLIENLNLAEEKTVHLSHNSIRVRLARSLLKLREMYGLKEDGLTLEVELTREELANLIGAATETTIRMLSAFKKEKKIELSGKNLKILNIDSLEDLVKGPSQ